MGSDHPIGAAVVKPVQQCLGDGCPYLGLGTAAKLVYQQQRAIIGVPLEIFHIHQVGAIGGKVVVDRLLITYIDKDIAEDTHA